MSEKVHSALKGLQKFPLKGKYFMGIWGYHCHFVLYYSISTLRDIFFVANIGIKSYATTSAGASLEANC